MNKKQSFILYKDFYDQLSELSTEQAGLLFKAIYAHQLGEEYYVDDAIVKFALKGLVSQFKRDDAKYKETCIKRSVAGKYGAKQKLAKAGKRKQKVAKEADSDSDSDSDSVNESENVSSKHMAETGVSTARKLKQYTENFETFWMLYKKGSKANAFEAWKKQRVNAECFSLILEAVPKYRAYCESIERPLKDGQGWLNGRFWESEWTHQAQGTTPKTEERKVLFHD